MRKLVIATVAMSIAMSASAQSSNWTVRTDTDPLTDEKTLSATSQIDDYVVLLVSCMQSTMVVSLSNDVLDIELGDTRKVTWRVDQDEPVVQMWRNIDTGGSLTFGEEALDLAKRIAAANERFVIQSGRSTRVFSVKGSAAAIGKVLSSCGA